MKRFMKGTAMILYLSVLCIGLTGCGHEHSWYNATCTTPKTCRECGETEGAPLGHDWMEATCKEPKTCERCGETKGSVLEHSWVEATCTSPKTCRECGETEGEALDHSWEDATCQNPKTCSVCGATEGDVGEHDLNEKGKCIACGEQVGFALNMSNYSQYVNLSFDYHYTEAASGREMPAISLVAEPLKNVVFKDVIVTWQYYAGNEKQERRLHLDETGTGRTGYHNNGGSVSGGKIISISGYIIE